MTITKQIYQTDSNYGQNCPIMIKIEHHGLEKWIPTSVSCDNRHWDNLNKVITEDDPVHRIKNETVEAHFRRVAGKIQDHLDNYIFNNLEIICDSIEWKSLNDPSSSHVSNHMSATLLSVIEMKIQNISALNTRRGYRSLKKYFENTYGDGPRMAEIDRTFLAGFDRQLKKDFQFHQPTRHLMLARMRAVLNFARDNGKLPLSVAFKLPKVPFRPHDRNLSESYVKKIFQLYKKKFAADPAFLKPDTFALAIFILDIAFQGLAPVDLASLKINQIKIRSISQSYSGHGNSPELETGHETDRPIEVVFIRTSRQKTSQHVTVVSALEPIKPIIDNLMKGKEQDDYLLPCFLINKTYTPEQRQDRLANYFYKLSSNLNKALKEENIDRDEMGDTRRVTFYYARHAFCNLIDGLDVPRYLIQHMIGHRTTVLETNYLRRITPWEQAQLSNAILSPLLEKD